MALVSLYGKSSKKTEKVPFSQSHPIKEVGIATKCIIYSICRACGKIKC